VPELDEPGSLYHAGKVDRLKGTDSVPTDVRLDQGRPKRADPALSWWFLPWRYSRARSALLTPLILTKSAWRHGPAKLCPLLIRLQNTLILVKGRSSTWRLVAGRDRGRFLFQPGQSRARGGCHTQLGQVTVGAFHVKGSRHRFLLVIVNLKYRQKPGDCQNLLDLGAQIQEFQLPSPLGNCSEGTHQFTNPRAVDVIYLRQVEDDLPHTVVHEVFYRASNDHRSLAKDDLAADIQNVNVPDGACMNVHVSLPDSIVFFFAQSL